MASKKPEKREVEVCYECKRPHCPHRCEFRDQKGKAYYSSGDTAKETSET